MEAPVTFYVKNNSFTIVKPMKSLQLRDSTNKKELFQFLTQKVSKHDYPGGKQVYITSGQLYSRNS